MSLTVTERSELEIDLVNLWADLGRLLAEPALPGVIAKAKRNVKLANTRREIARLTRLLYAEPESDPRPEA